jgi:hypothetical protein
MAQPTRRESESVEVNSGKLFLTEIPFPFSENPLSESASEAHPGPFFSFSGHFSMVALLHYV